MSEPMPILLQKARIAHDQLVRQVEELRERLDACEQADQRPKLGYCSNCSNVGWVLYLPTTRYSDQSRYVLERCQTCKRFPTHEKAGSAAQALIARLLEARAKLLEEQPF